MASGHPLPVLPAPAGAGGPAPPAVSETALLQAVLRAKTEWEQTVDAIDDPISLQDGFVIRRGNRALALLGNLPLQQLPGRRCHELIAGSATPCAGCPIASDPPPTAAAKADVAAGGRTYEVSVFPFAGSGNGWIVRHRDVTFDRAAAAALKAQERMAAVGRLAAGAAHEINNPLSFLIANLSSLGHDIERLEILVRGLDRVLVLLRDGAEQGAIELLSRFRAAPQLEALRLLAADGPERVAEALVGAQRVAGIVRALRSLATERTGEPMVVDATDSLERAVGRLREESAEPHPVEWNERHPLPIFGHPQGLDEAFYQVVRNATQFSPTGIPVRLSSRARKGRALLRVEDLGPGIPPQDRDLIFEPFFTTRPPGEGLGLGLTIAYGIVRQHGGEIRVESRAEAGTAVEISLPLYPERE